MRDTRRIDGEIVTRLVCHQQRGLELPAGIVRVEELQAVFDVRNERQMHGAGAIETEDERADCRQR